MDKQVIRLTEAQLKEKIKASLREKIENGELDESFWGSLKGFGDVFKNKANTAGQAVGNAAKNVGNKVRNAAQKAGNAVNKQVQDFKQGMAAGSDEEDYNKVFNKLDQWAQAGYFGDSRQAASQIKGLKNAMMRNFQTKHGRDMNVRQ